MNALVRALETSQQHRFTLDDVLRMQEAGILDESARVELIDGALVEMASEGDLHSRVKMLSPTNAPDPDLYLYDADLPLRAVDGTNVGLVIEVAQSSIRSDLAFKAELYAEHGVRDYWVVDVNTDTITIHRDPIDGVYRDVARHVAEDTVTSLVLPSVSLRLADLPPIR